MAYPSLPASPTLTNPDMILPYGEYDSTPSPHQHPFEPPSPPGTWKGSRPADLQFSLGPPHLMGEILTPTTPIIYGNGTMLSDIGEVTEAESTAGRLPKPAERRALKGLNGPLRASPIMGQSALLKRTRPPVHERKISQESTSTLTSEAPPSDVFADFDDDMVSVDDSNFQGDDEESVADSYSEEVVPVQAQSVPGSDANIGMDEEKNSSAVLSRRAEQILSNAKRRLNVRFPSKLWVQY